MLNFYYDLLVESDTNERLYENSIEWEFEREEDILFKC
jgi:hypothetical protein